MTITNQTVAWLLTEGGVEPLTAVRKIFWPGQAKVTHPNGTTSIEPTANILSQKDLGIRFFDVAALKEAAT